MSEPLVHHEIVNYNSENPFFIMNFWITAQSLNRDALSHHWHSDLEICYIVHGDNAVHTIDGRQIKDHSGKCIVINSESIHSIDVDYTQARQGELAAVILIISKEFV